MTISQELEQTKAQLASLQASVSASTATAETFTVKIAELESTIAANVATITGKDQTISALTAEVETLKASAKSAEMRALDIAASAGVPPVAAQPKADTKQMSRKEFSALSPLEQLTFCRNGGKITE